MKHLITLVLLVLILSIDSKAQQSKLNEANPPVDLLYSILNSEHPSKEYLAHRNEIYQKLFTTDDTELLIEFLKKVRIKQDLSSLENSLIEGSKNCQKLDLNVLRQKFSHYEFINFFHKRLLLSNNGFICLENEKYYFEITGSGKNTISFYGTLSDLIKLDPPRENAAALPMMPAIHSERKFYQKKEVLIPLALLAGFLMYSMHDKEIIIER